MVQRSINSLLSGLGQSYLFIDCKFHEIHNLVFAPLTHPNTVGTWAHKDPQRGQCKFSQYPTCLHTEAKPDSQLSEMVYGKSAQGQRDGLNDHLGPSYFLTNQREKREIWGRPRTPENYIHTVTIPVLNKLAPSYL